MKIVTYSLLMMTLAVLPMGCASKTVYQTNTVYIQDCNGTRVDIKTADTQPTDIGRGLSATIPIPGF